MNKEELKMLQELQKENAEKFEELENTFWQDYYNTKKIFEITKKIFEKEDKKN